MGSLLLSVIVASCACCPSFEPRAPLTSRAVESGWGPSWNGVSMMFATDADTVDLGARMKVEMFFRFFPLDSDGHVTAFVVQPEHRPHLVFSGGPAGKTYVRHAYRVGMPIFDDPYYHKDLRPGAFDSRGEFFHLLSSDGEQIPPGDYRVHVEYSNPGTAKRAYWGDDERLKFEPYPPGVVWSGSLSTSELLLHVRDKGPEPLPCELPTRIEITTAKDGQLMWRWDSTSFEPDTLTVRPGFIVGCRSEYRKSIGGKAVKFPDFDDADTLDVARFREVHAWAGWSSLDGGLPRWRRGWNVLAGPRIGDVASEAHRLVMEVDVTVFETSAADQHMWMPEAGDYRVLRKCEIRATWPPEAAAGKS